MIELLIFNLEVSEGSKLVEEDIEFEMFVGYLDGVVYQIMVFRCCGEGLDWKYSLRIFSIEGEFFFNVFLRDGVQRVYEKRVRGYWILRGGLEREIEDSRLSLFGLI